MRKKRKRTLLIGCLVCGVLAFIGVKYWKKYGFLCYRPSLLEIRDRQEIAKLFVINVEYYRKNYDADDPGRAFKRYAFRTKVDGDFYHRDIPSPLPTDSQITVKVRKIYYAKDSLHCVALLSIRRHYDRIAGLEDNSPEGDKYDALALIGARKKKVDRLKIYTYYRWFWMSFHSETEAVAALNSSLTGRWDGWYITEPEYFSGGYKPGWHYIDYPAHEFRKYKDGYRYEYQENDYDEEVKTDYLSNKPDSIISKYYP